MESNVIDLSHIEQIPVDEYLWRVLDRHRMKVWTEGNERYDNEFSLRFAHGYACCQLGRRIRSDKIEASVTVELDIRPWRDKETLVGIELEVDYQASANRKQFNESYDLNELPAHLSGKMLRFRATKEWFAKIDAVYQELIDLLNSAAQVVHGELHTDVSAFEY